MDTQHHQIKNTSPGPGSHGVHLCHKCRWPFPNANPSSKLRRSHKKVCGTIEGYKLFESDDHLAALEGGHASEEGQRTPSTSDNPVTAIPSIQTSDLEVIEQVKDQLENYNPFSEATIEDSPVGSVGVTDLHFNASPVDATRESPEPYLNEIDKQASYNPRGESLTPVADIGKESKLESKENKSLDFVTQALLAANRNVTGDANYVGSAVEKVEVSQNGSRLMSDSVNSSLQKVSESSLGFGIGNATDVTGSLASDVKNVERNHSDRKFLSSENQGASIANEVGPLPEGFELLSQTSNMVDVTNTSQTLKESSGRGCESSQGKGDDKLETRFDEVYVSQPSSRQDDSLHVKWGPVSVVTLQSDTATSGSAGGPSEKSQAALQICKGAAECHSVKSDDFAPPSFMTSVKPGNGVPQEATQQGKAEDPKAGRFLSMSNVVNELQGRKKNEEIIVKATNLSTGREYTPVKSLLGEVRSPNIKQPPSTTRNDEISLKSTDTAVTTMESMLRSERNDKERESSPVETKKEKRNRWLSFVCCSPAVDRDL